MQILVYDFYCFIGINIRGGNRALLVLLYGNSFRRLGLRAQHQLLYIKDYLGHILNHSRHRGKLVLVSVKPDTGYRGPFY